MSAAPFQLSDAERSLLVSMSFERLATNAKKLGGDLDADLRVTLEAESATARTLLVDRCGYGADALAQYEAGAAQ